MAIDWDSLYELAPSDSAYIKDTDDAIRSTKTAVRERLTKEHEFDLAGQSRQGLHRAGSAVAFYQTSAPTTRNGVALGASDAGILFVSSSDMSAQVWGGSAFSGIKSSITTNIAGGAAGQIPYQSGAGATAFIAAGTVGYVLTGNDSSAPTWTEATGANTPLTIVKRDVSGNFAAGTISASLSGNASTATALAGGVAGDIPYQTSAGVTAFITKEVAGCVLTTTSGGYAWVFSTDSNVVSTVVKRNSSGDFAARNMYGNASTASAILGGSAGQLPYQSAESTTAFLAAGTSSQVLKGGTSPSWQAFASTNTASALVQRDASGNFAAGTITAALTGNAATSTSLASGSAGQIPYQSGASTTAFLAAGTAGYVLTSGGAGAPSWGEATGANTPLTLVKRDASGGFAAGNISASLTGNVIGNVIGNVTGDVTGNVTGTSTNATNVNVAQVSDNVDYPIALVASAGAGSKGIKSGTSEGTYNPSTNKAAISISGDAATVNGQAVTTVGDGLKAKHGYVHIASVNSDSLFDVVAPAIPNVNDWIALHGVITAVGPVEVGLTLAFRTSSTIITCNGYSLSSGALTSALTFEDGSSTAYTDASFSW